MDDLQSQIPALLDTIQLEMLQRAKADSDARLQKGETWKDFMTYLNQGFEHRCALSRFLSVH